MKQDDCFELGIITKTHALQGEVVIHLDVDDPSNYEGLESVFIEEKGNLVPYLIEYIALQDKKKALVKFEEIDGFEAAEAILKLKLFLPLTSLPKLENGAFYYHEIIGYQVIDKDLGELGTINSYINAAQDLLVMDYKNVEVLIPVSDEIVGKANHEQKTISVDLPGGLIDLYINN